VRAVPEGAAFLSDGDSERSTGILTGMRIVIQRVSRASVAVEGENVASIGRGLLVLVGVAEGDGEEQALRLARKCAEMRIFTDEEGKFNLSLLDVGGEALVVSQFTLLADVRKGRRPSFVEAAAPAVAEPLVEAFAEAMRGAGVRTQTGRFGAKMAVELVNDGPVTILLDSEEMERPRRG
jgi:D-tyrosyl-tRNA(Tyr) deacylase